MLGQWIHWLECTCRSLRSPAGQGSWGGYRGGGSVGSHTSIPKFPDSGSRPCGLIAYNPRPGHTFSRAQAVQEAVSGVQGLTVAVSFLSTKNPQEVHSIFIFLVNIQLGCICSILQFFTLKFLNIATTHFYPFPRQTRRPECLCSLLWLSWIWRLSCMTLEEGDSNGVSPSYVGMRITGRGADRPRQL